MIGIGEAVGAIFSQKQVMIRVIYSRDGIFKQKQKFFYGVTIKEAIDKAIKLEKESNLSIIEIKLIKDKTNE